MDAQTLYRELQSLLTARRLQELTLGILEAKKEGNHRKLQFLHQTLFGDAEPALPGDNRPFFRLIHFFHPDRLALLSREVREAAEKEDLDRLRFYQKALSTPVLETGGAASRRSAVRPREGEWNYGETYGYGMPRDEAFHDGEEASFFDEETDWASDFDDTFRGEEGETWDDGLRENDEEMDFIRAVKAEYAGVMEMSFTPSDLAALSDELELTGYGIEDLEGLDYCRGLIHLDLSDNRISRLYDLRNLYHLKELYLAGNRISDLSGLEGLSALEILDLADNDIDDITPLLSLTRLKFVNLMGNPVADSPALRKLKEQVELLLVF